DWSSDVCSSDLLLAKSGMSSTSSYVSEKQAVHAGLANDPPSAVPLGTQKTIRMVVEKDGHQSACRRRYHPGVNRLWVTKHASAIIRPRNILFVNARDN